MNRFLNKKKVVETPPSPPSLSKKWKKGKAGPSEQQRPEFDLTIALPSSDDFRTSLIMPNLSARFSMLREQDNPNSKIGKAADDSVLQPKRRSRLLEYTNGLGDIAEVASIHSSMVPPFARKRSGSCSSEGTGTDNDSFYSGSMMSRARPGEANTLFGGRQKVYRVPHASSSVRNISGGSEKATTLGSRPGVAYDDDSNLSGYQRWRQQERDAIPTPEAEDLYKREDARNDEQSNYIRGQDKSVMDPEDTATTVVVSLAHSDSGSSQGRKRSSDSTSTSTPSLGRTSTAATSIVSQPTGSAAPSPNAGAQVTPAATVTSIPTLERSLTKRRLYEQGMERNMYEQQASQLTRLNSIQRSRSPIGGPVPPTLSHSKSIQSMQSRTFQPYAFQPKSPPASFGLPPLTTFDQIHNKANNAISATIYPQSPTSPLMSDSEDYQTLHSALEPGDRGKATAMGAFNKPNQQFDEEQYLKRQLQLHHAKEAAIARKGSIDVFEKMDDGAERFDSPRQFSDTHSSQASRSRTASPEITTTSQTFHAFPIAANQIRVVRNGVSEPRNKHSPVPETHRTFFGDNDASDEDDERDEAGGPSRSGSKNAHPATRHAHNSVSTVAEEEEETAEQRKSKTLLNIASGNTLKSQAALSMPPPPLPPLQTKVSAMSGPHDRHRDAELSPLGTSENLGGLIHQHLRNPSVQSSIYGGAIPTGSIPDLPEGAARIARNTIAHSSYSDSQWDIDLDSYYGGQGSRSPISPSESTVPSKGQPLASAGSKANVSRPPTSSDADSSEGGAWQKHTRDASTATQAERDAFDNELAARQKAIQEKMKSIVDTDSRGSSPAPSSGGAFKALGMLKPKASQDLLSRDPSTKAFKMLGINSSSQNAAIYEDSPRIGVPQQGVAWSSPSSPTWPLGPKEQKSVNNLQNANVRKPSVVGSRDDKVTGSRSVHPSERARTMTRSNSISSRVRSRSRQGKGSREALENEAMPVPSLAQDGQSLTRPQGRLRSASKSTGFFDTPTLKSIVSSTTSNGRLAPAGTSSTSNTPLTYYNNTDSTTRPPLFPAHTLPLVSANGTHAQSHSKPSALSNSTAGRPSGSVLKKRWVSKSDISEPTLVSSTSNVDTVDLPAGASLKNGMPVATAASVTASRRRKLFGFSRENSPEESRDTPDAVRNPLSSYMAERMASPTAPSIRSFASPTLSADSRNHPSAVRSQESLDTSSQFGIIGSPALNSAGMF